MEGGGRVIAHHIIHDTLPPPHGITEMSQWGDNTSMIHTAHKCAMVNIYI